MNKDFIEIHCSSNTLRYIVVFAKCVSTYLIATKEYKYRDGNSFSEFCLSKFYICTTQSVPTATKCG